MNLEKQIAQTLADYVETIPVAELQAMRNIAEDWYHDANSMMLKFARNICLSGEEYKQLHSEALKAIGDISSNFAKADHDRAHLRKLRMLADTMYSIDQNIRRLQKTVEVLAKVGITVTYTLK